MIKIITILFLLICTSLSQSFGQPQKDSTLIKKLDSVRTSDQYYRQVLEYLRLNPECNDSIAIYFGISKDSVSDNLMALQEQADHSNMEYISKLIKEKGYPGQSMVGQEMSMVAWLVLQHSDKIDSFLPLIKTAAEKRELAFRYYALMYDRWLMNKNQEQVYGTQATKRILKNKSELWFIWPIKDPKGVNVLRKKVGFKTTIEEYAKDLGIDYKVIKISELQIDQNGK